ncbi:MAG: hypothetical protein WDN23_06005 [Edaphobacter sp.]
MLVSSDPNWVYFRSDGHGIWKVPVDGGQEFRVPELSGIDTSRYIAVVGESLYFVEGEATPSHIERYNFLTHRSTSVGVIERSLVDGTPSLTVSPDEHWLLYAQQDESSSDIMSPRPE